MSSATGVVESRDNKREARSCALARSTSASVTDMDRRDHSYHVIKIHKKGKYSQTEMNEIVDLDTILCDKINSP